MKAVPGSNERPRTARSSALRARTSARGPSSRTGRWSRAVMSRSRPGSGRCAAPARPARWRQSRPTGDESMRPQNQRHPGRNADLDTTAGPAPDSHPRTERSLFVVKRLREPLRQQPYAEVGHRSPTADSAWQTAAPATRQGPASVDTVPLRRLWHAATRRIAVYLQPSRSRPSTHAPAQPARVDHFHLAGRRWGCYSCCADQSTMSAQRGRSGGGQADRRAACSPPSKSSTPPTPIGACTSTGCSGVQARPHAVHREACLGAGFGLPACECDGPVPRLGLEVIDRAAPGFTNQDVKTAHDAGIRGYWQTPVG